MPILAVGSFYTPAVLVAENSILSYLSSTVVGHRADNATLFLAVFKNEKPYIFGAINYN